MVLVETWFTSDDPPKNSSILVSRSDGSKLAEVPINDQGVAVFYYNEADDLRVDLKIPGHPKSFTIPHERLEGADVAERFADRGQTESSLKDVLIGVALLFAIAAFVLNLRKVRALREMRRTNPPNGPSGSESPTSLGRILTAEDAEERRGKRSID